VVDKLGTGTLELLPRREFPLAAAADAFRFMAHARHIGKLVLVPAAPALGESIRSDATYLVTGGTGGIGLHLARWLVARGARHLVLIGRQAADRPAVVETVAELRAAGAQVLVGRADVASVDDLARVLAEVERSMPPLRGIVHAAGIVDDGVLRHQDWSRFTRVLAPKVSGARNLEMLTRHAPLDFFIVCSSIASVLGAPGQGSYAAANAFLDAFATQRRAEGLPGCSVAWGSWADTGMTVALTDTDRQRLAARGLLPMTPERALDALGQVRPDAPGPRVIAALDGSALASQPLAILRDLVSPGAATRTTPDLLARWQDTPPARRRPLLMSFIRAEAIRVLGLGAHQPIAPRQAFNDLGLDSLMAIELRNSLSTALEHALPGTLLFDHPTIESLADYLSTHVPALVENAAQPSVDLTRAGAPADIAEMSEAEAERLLLAELDGGVPNR
jgi:NAD(P)-dependent dehydrogenase (short-subunit alcohol dehydrogenase family)/acyl carrier protein